MRVGTRQPVSEPPACPASREPRTPRVGRDGRFAVPVAALQQRLTASGVGRHPTDCPVVDSRFNSTVPSQPPFSRSSGPGGELSAGISTARLWPTFYLDRQALSPRPTSPFGLRRSAAYLIVWGPGLRRSDTPRSNDCESVIANWRRRRACDSRYSRAGSRSSSRRARAEGAAGRWRGSVGTGRDRRPYRCGGGARGAHDR